MVLSRILCSVLCIYSVILHSTDLKQAPFLRGFNGGGANILLGNLVDVLPDLAPRYLMKLPASLLTLQSARPER